LTEFESVKGTKPQMGLDSKTNKNAISEGFLGKLAGMKIFVNLFGQFLWKSGNRFQFFQGGLLNGLHRLKTVQKGS
jgi:hypothetical protein